MQPGTLQLPLLSPDQWRLSQQVRYLPLAILSCTVIFLTSAPSLAQEVIRGEVDEMDMWEGRRWEREGRAEASALNLLPQNTVTWRFTAPFHAPFDGASCNIFRGSGRPYCWQSCLT